MNEAQLAAYYDQTHDVSGFDPEHPEGVIPARRRLDVTISLRFSPEEIDLLRAEAERAGMKVTAFIRALALEHAAGPVLDRSTLRKQLTSVVILGPGNTNPSKIGLIDRAEHDALAVE